MLILWAQHPAEILAFWRGNRLAGLFVLKAGRGPIRRSWTSPLSFLGTPLVDAAQKAAGQKDGDYSDPQGFIFVSSAKSTTPFHVDAEENILIQIRGDKFIHIFDDHDRSLVPEEAMEISPSKHRNQHYEPSFEARAQVFAMKEGDAVHLPHL